MADIWFDVDTAIAECPVNIMPLIDDGDFKTRETSVAYNAAGMDLVWNFVTTAGAYTQTAVTPTSSGAYDWAHQGDGMYSIEIPASGGGSINNDTEGFGWFTGVATGVLPWRGPVIGFRASGLNDALIDGAYSTTRGLAGTALPNAAADAAGGLIISDAGGLDADAQLVTKINAILDDTDLIDDGTSGLAKIATDVAAILVDTADMQPKLGAPAGASISADIAAVKSDTAAILVDTGTTLDGKIDVILTDTGTTLPATLSAIDTVVDAIQAKTDNLPTDPADASVIAGRFDTLDSAISTVDSVADAIKAKTDNLPSDPADQSLIIAATDTIRSDIAGLNDLSAADVNAEVDTALADYDGPTKAELDSAVAGLATASGLSTLDGKIDTIDSNVDAILDDTGTSGVVVASLAANSITAAAIAADAGNEIADAILNRDMSTGTDSGSSTVRTVRQALRLNRNKVEISGGTMTVYKEDDSTSSWTSAITTDEAAEPITASDPAGP